MGTAHSLRKLVKETSSSTCTRIIFVEDSADWISVKLDEYLTDWTRSFPNTSQKISTWLSHNHEDAEAYARYLFEACLLDGFVRAR
jgi:hypothetical protein